MTDQIHQPDSELQEALSANRRRCKPYGLMRQRDRSRRALPPKLAESLHQWAISDSLRLSKRQATIAISFLPFITLIFKISVGISPLAFGQSITVISRRSRAKG